MCGKLKPRENPKVIGESLCTWTLPRFTTAFVNSSL